jgi:hypothetical protein
VEEGESFQERHSHVGPGGTQEYSSFLVVEESEVGGQHFILERCCHWGIPLSLTVVGIVRLTRWGLVHWGPNGEGQRSLRRTRSSGSNRNCYGVGQDLVCLLSEKFPEEVNVKKIKGVC